MREEAASLLVLWGKYDLSFEPFRTGGLSPRRAEASVHVLDAGHFALDTRLIRFRSSCGAS